VIKISENNECSLKTRRGYSGVQSLTIYSTWILIGSYNILVKAISLAFPKGDMGNGWKIKSRTEQKGCSPKPLRSYDTKKPFGWENVIHTLSIPFRI